MNTQWSSYCAPRCYARGSRYEWISVGMLLAAIDSFRCCENSHDILTVVSAPALFIGLWRSNSLVDADRLQTCRAQYILKTGTSYVRASRHFSPLARPFANAVGVRLLASKQPLSGVRGAWYWELSVVLQGGSIMCIRCKPSSCKDTHQLVPVSTVPLVVIISRPEVGET